MGDMNIMIICTKKSETLLSVLRMEKIVESITKNGTHKGEKNIRKVLEKTQDLEDIELPPEIIYD